MLDGTVRPQVGKLVVDLEVAEEQVETVDRELIVVADYLVAVTITIARAIILLLDNLVQPDWQVAQVQSEPLALLLVATTH